MHQGPVIKQLRKNSMKSAKKKRRKKQEKQKDISGKRGFKQANIDEQMTDE